MTERTYYGTKRVTAWPRRRLDDALKESQVNDEGYAVRYADGYESWSPKDVFEAAYKPTDAMDLSGALAAMKDGHKVQRLMWTDCLMLDRSYDGGTVCWLYDDGSRGRYDAVSGDLLAEDWMVVR